MLMSKFTNKFKTAPLYVDLMFIPSLYFVPTCFQNTGYASA